MAKRCKLKQRKGHYPNCSDIDRDASVSKSALPICQSNSFEAVLALIRKCRQSLYSFGVLLQKIGFVNIPLALVADPGSGNEVQHMFELEGLPF
eukprot:scaffold135691_cov18-Prasinocladus_malaysianus.AAC.1